MINYELPTSVEIDGQSYPINRKGDYRMILDVISALTDVELPSKQNIIVALNLFYGFNLPDNVQAAFDAMSRFIDCDADGQEKKNEQSKAPLMSWEHDFPIIVTAINRVIGCEIRALPYLHWWTFIGGYGEIDEHSVFSTVVGIRRKLREGAKLDPHERSFLNANRDLVNIPVPLSDEDKEWLEGDDNG